MRSETRIETDREYRPGDPVIVRVIRREQRTTVSDERGAVQRAGRSGDLGRASARVLAEFDVNVTRRGEVSLPVVAVGPTEDEVVGRISDASLALYDELLESSR